MFIPDRIWALKKPKSPGWNSLFVSIYPIAINVLRVTGSFFDCHTTPSDTHEIARLAEARSITFENRSFSMEFQSKQKLDLFLICWLNLSKGLSMQASQGIGGSGELYWKDHESPVPRVPHNPDYQEEDDFFSLFD